MHVSYLTNKKVQLIGLSCKTNFLAIVFIFMGTATGLGQKLHTWFTADRAVNSPAGPNGQYHLFTPLPPIDGTPVTSWYDFIDFNGTFQQNAIEHPDPANYNMPPPLGFNYSNDGTGDWLIPTGSDPSPPLLRRNALNFNPALEFDGTGAGQALHFRGINRNEATIFIVFQGNGQGSSPETQRLLFGGDITNYIPANAAVNLSIGLSDGNRFSIGRTREAGLMDPNLEEFTAGTIDLEGRPTIGVFIRDIKNSNQELLETRVNGLDDISWDRPDTYASRPLFHFNRLGKHFNSTDATSERNFTGQIAEVMVMAGPPINDHITNGVQRTESYLAIKYGITLNTTGGLGSNVGNNGFDYLAADGTVIWDADFLASYIYDIAGIGRDRFQDFFGSNNSSGTDDTAYSYNLHQVISKSVNPEAILTIATNSDFTSDNFNESRNSIDPAPPSESYLHNYLLWGSNRGDINRSTAELPNNPPSVIASRISREWLVQKNSNALTSINGVSLQIDLSGSDFLNGLVDDATCTTKLLIDRDGDGNFTTGTINIIDAIQVDIMNNLVYFENVDLAHGDVFTIGFEDIPPTASNPANTIACDLPPAIDINVVMDETDNCTQPPFVNYESETSDLNVNPETIIRTYSVTDNMGNSIDVEHTILVYLSPNVGAGSDEETCSGSPFDLSTGSVLPTATNFSSISWSTDGDGTFDDNTALTPIYIPGNNDSSNGSVILTLQANGNGNCSAATDSMVLTITPVPTVHAGSDELICNTDNLDLSLSGTTPTATNFSSLFWSTSGDGGFDDNTLLTPIYDPGPNDIANSSVILSLQANGNGSCLETVDTMTLFLEAAPMVNAGSDEVICAGSPFNLSNGFILPTANNFSSLSWSTDGDGIFDDNTVLTPVYIPGDNDITHGSVTLTLQVNGNGNCSAAIDSMVLSITPAPTVNAGSNETICATDNLDLSMSVILPAASNFSSLAWNTSGDGNFDDVGLLAPRYSPGPEDIANGSVTLTLEGINGTCTTTDSMELTVTTLSISTAPVSESCSGNADAVIQVNVDQGSGPYAVKLNDSPEQLFLNNNFSLTELIPGIYTLEVIDDNGCSTTTILNIPDIAPLEVALDRTSNTLMTANTSGGTPPYLYFFNNNQGTSENIYAISQSENLIVRVVDANGCETVAVENISFVLPEIEIPNFFTPNNDGQNDFWKPKNTELYQDVQTIIFDRYGRPIKTLVSNGQGWDGSYKGNELPYGDYWYLLTASDNNGNTIERIGHLTLYR